MAKHELDSAIISSLKIAASGSFADSVKMLDIDSLVESPDNFFEVNRIGELADTILRQGYVKENLIVRKLEGDKYEIISGHRRIAAVRLLLERGESISRKLPCLVQSYSSEDDKNLDLILMNLSTRRISDDELFKSYEVLNSSLQNLKKDGVQFGQVQKTLADLLGVSTGQVAKMQYIDKHATEEEKDDIRKGETSINTAGNAVKVKEKKKPPKPVSKSEPTEKYDDEVINIDNSCDEDYSDSESDNCETAETTEVDELEDFLEFIQECTLDEFLTECGGSLRDMLDTYSTTDAKEKAIIAGFKRFVRKER
jgi:ParB family chromosome partitioning protein